MSLREFLFRTSIDVASKANRTNVDSAELRNWMQRVTITGTEPRNVYVTDWAYVAGAVAASVTGVLAVLALYAGVWRLARVTSLNPLEVAHAFGAPLLAEADSNATLAELARECGWKRVRYAAVADKDDVAPAADKMDNGGGGSDNGMLLGRGPSEVGTAASAAADLKPLRWCFTLDKESKANEDGDAEA